MPSSASNDNFSSTRTDTASYSSYHFQPNILDRPIYGENSYWYTISSNWLGIGSPNYGGYSQFGRCFWRSSHGEANVSRRMHRPQTSHIMWTKPLQKRRSRRRTKLEILGDTFSTDQHIWLDTNNPIILAGKLYYTKQYHSLVLAIE